MGTFLIIILIFSLVLFFVFFIIYSIKKSNEEYEKKHLKQAQINYEVKFNNNFKHSKDSFLYLANQTEEITKTWDNVKDTKNQRKLEQSSGIYAIYVNTEDIKEIIPIYVGQARDIFKRWKQHQNQIEKIIKENSNTRTYKKIVHYLNVHNLKIQDLNFCVLEKCNEIELNEREMFYINLYNSDIYGFNQTKGNKNYF
ncbi:GIY-YIG catalytic domain containing protein [Candidatus Hepatoplasma crinochetorum Av]|uniref:GIY-YIG catalytic domain containing protein n=1 Tax=Candidatus Hepatoplasma crinochetorum Av TaxID=1427984 RepID=W8GF36_9MOLU|nr:GIY-YIG nuclease family protein [Candidatus Hepatoplasma crinochetorum]AHK22218.1 GIY-YIG catalytic domain containing protein [Candidatus Hepatoplasma crinochetorum Av]